jgi:hypothetical protein
MYFMSRLATFLLGSDIQKVFSRFNCISHSASAFEHLLSLLFFFSFHLLVWLLLKSLLFGTFSWGSFGLTGWLLLLFRLRLVTLGCWTLSIFAFRGWDWFFGWFARRSFAFRSLKKALRIAISQLLV